jgi:hypothetical protein
LCSLAFKTKQFCDYCKQIYFDESEYQANDGKEWVECEGCKKWNHIECEVERNADPEFRKVIDEQDYYCIPCIKANKSLKLLKQSKAASTSNQGDDVQMQDQSMSKDHSIKEEVKEKAEAKHTAD